MGQGRDRARHGRALSPSTYKGPGLRSVIVTPLIVACALFMENLDSTIISTSLPAIARDLHEDPLALKLAMTSYMLALAVFIPASGWVADRYGAKKVFRIAIVVFTAGSILCGLSSTLPQFVAARIFQGVGGAMMTPVGRLLLLRSIERSQIVRAMAYLTIPALIGPVIGPPLGGFISTYLHWRWNFWINVPIGALGVVLVSLFIKDVRERDVAPFDAVGFALSGLGLTSLIFGVTVIGRGFIPDPLNAVLILAGLAGVVGYVFHARRIENPIIDLRLLQIPTFAASIGGGFLFRVGIGATPFLLPLLFQVGFGMTAFGSGSMTFVTAVGAMAMKTTAAPILAMFGFRRTLIANALLSMLFLAVNALFTSQTPTMAIMMFLLVGGFFRSLQFTAINSLAYADVSDDAMSKATSFSGVVQQLSLSAGIAIGAGSIEATRRLTHGSVLAASDFFPAFLVVAAISGASALIFSRLPADAGNSIVRRGGEPTLGAPQS